MKKLIVLLVLMASTPAWAHGHHRYYHVRHYHTFAQGLGHGLVHMLDSARPHAWCGWYMRQVMGVASAEYNLARNWAHYGNATYAHPGAVVVWPHHVGRIEGSCNGGWLVNSGNDGHAVRTRCRSVAGAIAFRE